jgi:hypothetical protein
MSTTVGDSLQMGDHFGLGQMIAGIGAVLEDQRAEVINVPSLCLAYVEVAHVSSLLHKHGGMQGGKTVARRGAP